MHKQDGCIAVFDVGKTPEFFDDFNRSYVILTLSIVLQTRVALERTGPRKGMSVFIEGGFSHNEFFTNLITSFSPQHNSS